MGKLSPVLVVVLLLLPIMGHGYWIYTLGLSFANAIAILSVSFLVRYSGEVSIGHGVFVAVGAYAVALCERYAGVSLAASLPLAVILGALLGLVFAFPSRKLSGISLAVVTMALALALPELLLHFSKISGGYEGLYVKLPIIPIGPDALQRYYVPLFCLLAVVAVLRHFRQSRQAMAMLLARTSSHAAESFGIGRGWARLSCLAISTAIASLAGALQAFSSSTVSPNSFTMWTSIFLLVGSVVSMYSLSLVGGLTGGLFLTLIPLLLAGAGNWVPVLYGAALLAVVLAANVLPSLRLHTNGGKK
ncbi:branched-chain amino acid ABC transporter permease [Caballeronia sp. LZ065]|uniref:branched-chain amino acid ABC transporter permease n=1 Tax=Caballeronia sp. LZ065 TaxID=3038571 RepID=UPI002865E09B|nr:branched-chain amino acid ABC transporter permease [Caballeronia sp. LZ065]MDR5781094.1 branched-chain amino acid ABC transporter permease [Caballeronia sp. LZ065]